MHKIKLILLLYIVLYSCTPKEKSITDNIVKNDMRWIYQVDSLLMPFWMSDEAYGIPPGNFPNYRNREGEVLGYENFNYSSVPEQFFEFLVIETDSLRRNYIRMNSRQVYAYCVAFHMTGNEDYLVRAKAGVDYLLEYGGYDSGSPYTYWQDGKGMPSKYQSTTQDLAYSLTGPTMYYYLTRDLEVLDKIMKVKDFTLTEYYDKSEVKENSKLVAWVKSDVENESRTAKRLLAVLDQLNAYLLLLAHVLPQDKAQPLYKDIENLAYSLKDNFYSSDHNLFWGDLENKKIGVNPTDFGHSIKSFWMLYTAAKMIKDKELEVFASSNAKRLLEVAYVKESGSWAEMYTDSTYAIGKNKAWWIFAELDQAAATLSLNDTLLYSKYLKQTYKYWDEKMIDHENKETHLLLDEDGNPIDWGFKTCHWKNGFHSLEHALIGFISTCNYNDEDVNLYFAFEKNKFPEERKIKPYYYDGKIKGKSVTAFRTSTFNKLSKVKITFEKIK